MNAHRPGRFPRGSEPPGALAELHERRLLRGLRSRFPKLAAALGREFDGLVLSLFTGSTTAPRSLRRASALFADQLLVAPELPVWCAELARIDLAYQEVLEAPYDAPMSKGDLEELRELDGRTLRLVPAHALVRVSTNVDELWTALDTNARLPAVYRLPRPRTVLVWRTDLHVSQRTVEADEAAALRAASRGIAFAELWVAFAHRDNPTARAVDILLAWIGAGVVARS